MSKSAAAKVQEVVTEEAAPIAPVAAYVPKYPPGVQMHDSGTSPYATKKPREEYDPKKPPAGWMGDYQTCGVCGDFVPGAACAKCAPRELPSNIHTSGEPRMVSR